MPENLHYTHFWAGLEQCRWRAEEGENPSPCPVGFSWHREVWAGSGAGLKQQGRVWAECSYSRRSLTSQNAVKYLVILLKSAFYSAFESCLRTADIRGISAATLPIPPGLGWDFQVLSLWEGGKPGIATDWSAEAGVRCCAWWDDIKRSTKNDVKHCAVWAWNRTLCAVFLTCNKEIPSLFLSLNLCLVCLFCF